MAINFPDTSASPWYNDPASGGNGVTYVYTSGGYWTAVQVTGSNAIDQTTGDARYVNVSGDNMTGNLTLDTNKITLNTNGSATFKSTVDVTSATYTYIGRRSSDNTATFAATDAGYVNIGPVSGNNSNIILDGSNGNATFAGYVDFIRNAGDGFGYLGIGPGGTNEKAAFVNRSGEIDFELYSNYTSSATVSINSNGSITAAGNIYSQVGNQFAALSYAGITQSKSDGTTASQILPDGSATFGSGNFDLAEYGALSIKRTDGNNYPLLRWGTDSTYAAGAIYPDGAANFSGNVGIGGNLNFSQEASSNYPEQKLKWSNDSTTTNGFYISQNQSRNGKIWHEQGLDILFGTNNAERMRLDSNGVVRIGGTETYNGSDKLTLSNNSGNCSLTIDALYGSESSVFFADGTNGNEAYRGYLQYKHNADALCIGTSGTERMRIDSSGRLLLGVSTGTAGSNNYLSLISRSTTNTDEAFGIQYPGVATYGFSVRSNGDYLIRKDGTDRMRITATGFSKHRGNGAGYYNVGGGYHEFTSDIASYVNIFQNVHQSAPSGLFIKYQATINNNSTSFFLDCEDNAARRFAVSSAGGIQNFQSNNSNLCDEREKKNIVDLDPKWDKVKSWELKKFHYNDDADTDDLRYGVIAQQVETVCPEVLSDWEKQSAQEAILDEDGNVTTPAREQILRKGVKEQQMMWMAIKALQEAMAKIETLETKVAQLEGN